MAESINEGILASFLANVGDPVETDEELATVETDKIDVPINSPEAGVLVEYLVDEGNTISVGQTVAIIETQDANSHAESQVKDESLGLSPSVSSVVGTTKPSSNARAPNSSGERVVSIRCHLETNHSCLSSFSETSQCVLT